MGVGGDSPSLISFMISVDVKHRIYLLTESIALHPETPAGLQSMIRRLARRSAVDV